MQLKLPGEAEIAVVPAAAFAELFGSVVLSANPESRFADGQTAGWTKFSYFGRLFITHPLDDQAWSAIRQRAAEAKQRALSSSAKKSNDGQATTSTRTGPLDGLGWESASHMRLVVRSGSSAIRWSVDFRPHSAADAQATQRALMEGLRPRAMFEVPAAEGVCLPYVFIQDDGQRPRSIAATYRLKDHPDVTIWLEDSTAQSMLTSAGDGTVIRAKDADRFAPEYKIRFFWSQDYQSPKTWRHLWPKLQDVRLDDRKGAASFVELKRQDDGLDYGYLAVVRGDPDAKQDVPDLMLYVIRDAKNALAKGKQPIGKDELLKMAESIAASVKRRPVK